jgi:hypothetical protein
MRHYGKCRAGLQGSQGREAVFAYRVMQRDGLAAQPPRHAGELGRPARPQRVRPRRRDWHDGVNRPKADGFCILLRTALREKAPWRLVHLSNAAAAFV